MLLAKSFQLVYGVSASTMMLVWWGVAGSADRSAISESWICCRASYLLHFRLYRSIGGDASDLQTQQFASRMVV